MVAGEKEMRKTTQTGKGDEGERTEEKKTDEHD